MATPIFFKRIVVELDCLIFPLQRQLDKKAVYGLETRRRGIFQPMMVGDACRETVSIW
ncbi:hypothetical protein [Lacipirellula sp.]|uniref:hypothetical protein n=1 Tax=Lacipirellula sp. TaxID=2691419 RepID=UPI003D10A270